jgi:hypothetical protein
MVVKFINTAVANGIVIANIDNNGFLFCLTQKSFRQLQNCLFRNDNEENIDVLNWGV